jgi:F-type H+-transporting ATPase subunit b
LKGVKRTTVFLAYFSGAIILIHLLAVGAFAADDGGNWRSVFDLVMRWLNFIILAFLLIKFSKGPIQNFLESKKQEVAREIERLESQKARVVRQIDEKLKALENSKDRLVSLKKRIIAQGEKSKNNIIEEATRESQIMLESARHKINSQIMQARNTLKSELVDAAINLAIQELPQKISQKEHQKFIDKFLMM